ncbi:phosphodiester glycosidase family protein [Yoonia sp. I 8.24]|uniref:phosphodiester glycosidase family protein n=1 Tax=Yoonia sp. I 8.24 TaxID=1537229 RepID=UPI001EE08EB0|nr:phosphodiester glycosidase family protein [Yoonia sp. I 8.24]MCG3269229.1 phosphodiester glycosidase family protein [Yoonia sp. I 8.24]
MRGLIFALLWIASPVAAVTCADVDYKGNSYTTCEVDAVKEDLRLFLRDDAGEILGGFSAVDNSIPDETLVFAMNAGMYHDDRAPVGHYVENGVEEMRIVPNAGPGNFGLLPNGVFCVNDGSAQVYETLSFIENAPACRDATQSGPMLVIAGALHPRFLIDSTSRYVRNGVGTTADGARAIFAISNNAVTFHEFGSFFRDFLQTPDALYFDGKVSRLYAPDLRRSDFGFQLGPIVGVVEQIPDPE